MFKNTFFNRTPPVAALGLLFSCSIASIVTKGGKRNDKNCIQRLTQVNKIGENQLHVIIIQLAETAGQRCS